MYSNYAFILAKFKLLIKYVINSLNVNFLLIILTHLTMFIVIITLLNPIYKFFVNLIKNKKITSSSHRIYKNINSISDCSACKSSSKSSSKSLSNSSSKSTSKSTTKSLTTVHKTNKKYKIKINKNKINKTLRNFKLE